MIAWILIIKGILRVVISNCQFVRIYLSALICLERFQIPMGQPDPIGFYVQIKGAGLKPFDRMIEEK